jgi:hypothetical protein
MDDMNLWFDKQEESEREFLRGFEDGLANVPYEGDCQSYLEGYGDARNYPGSIVQK